MNVENVIEYLITIAPAITAIVSIVASVIVAIKKTKSLNNQTILKLTEISKEMLSQTMETNQQNVDLKVQLTEILDDNAELRKQLNELTKKVK